MLVEVVEARSISAMAMLRQSTLARYEVGRGQRVGATTVKLRMVTKDIADSVLGPRSSVLAGARLGQAGV
jgi:hypothetical protein